MYAKNKQTPVYSAQELFILKEKKRKILITVIQIILFISFILLWEILTRVDIIDPFIFSSPLRIVDTTVYLFNQKTLFSHLGITVYETLFSFILVFGTGMAAGTILWLNKNIYQVLQPFFVILNSLPKSALAPLLIVWLGCNVKTIIITAVSITVFGTIINIYTCFNEIDKDKIKLIYTLGGTRYHAFFKVILPGSAKTLLGLTKVNIGLCLVGVIIGEFLAARSGLGYLIMYGSQVFKLDLVMTSIVFLCILAIIIYKLISKIEKRLG